MKLFNLINIQLSLYESTTLLIRTFFFFMDALTVKEDVIFFFIKILELVMEKGE